MNKKTIRAKIPELRKCSRAQIQITVLLLALLFILGIRGIEVQAENQLPKITYSSNTTLTADVFCSDLSILSGVTVTTDGHSIVCSGSFVNDGILNAGLAGNAGTTFSVNGRSEPNSYGGSGGGGGGGYAGTAGLGGSTLAPGGENGAGNGYSGAAPSPPSLTTNLIAGWYSGGIAQFLAGAGGGNNGGNPLDAAGSGAYGVYIQANSIVAGTIYAGGQNGLLGDGPSGGGGGGVVLLAYGTGGYTPGTYNIDGGVGGLGARYSGGAGGNGQVLTYNYGTSPPGSTGARATPPSSGIWTGVIIGIAIVIGCVVIATAILLVGRK